MAKKSVACAVCKDEHYLYSTNNAGETTATMCDCYRDYLARRTIEISMEKANVGTYDPGYTPQQYVGEKSRENVSSLIKFVNGFNRKYRGLNLYMFGGNSTQKTTLAKWVCVSAINDKLMAYYTEMNTLLKDLINDREESAVDHIEALYEKDILVIDEAFDPLKVTIYKSKFQIPYLDTFLRKRLSDARKSTIFVSNVEIDNIDRGIYGQSIHALVNRSIPTKATLEFQDLYNGRGRVDFDVEDLWA